MGIASARLLAAGVPRVVRLDALRLLGLLADHAASANTSRLEVAILSSQLGFDPRRGRQLLEALVAVEVVRIVGDEVTVVGAGTRALHLSGFLANVSRTLGEGSAAERPFPAPEERRARRWTGVGRGAPAPAQPAPVTVVASLAPDRRSRRGGIVPRVLAAAVAAGVVVWSTAAPSGEPEALRTFAGGASSTGRAPWATTPSVAEAGPQASTPEPEGTDLGSSSSPDGPDTTSPTPSGDRRGPPTVSPTPSGRLSPAPVPDGAQPGAFIRRPRPSEGRAPLARPSPDSARTLEPGPISPDPGSGGGCPVGPPQGSVSTRRLLPAVARDLMGTLATPRVEVRGAIANLSDAAMVVDAFEIVARTGEGTVTAVGAPSPLVVAANDVAAWVVVLPPEAGPEVPSTVEVHILDWSWTDPVYAALCPS